VRYNRQHRLGADPTIMMVVFTVIFGRLAKLPSNGSAPYALIVFAAVLPWSFL